MNRTRSSSLVPNLTISISLPDKVRTGGDGALITLQREEDDNPKPFVLKRNPTEDLFSPFTLSLFHISLSGDKSQSDIREKREVQLPVEDNQGEPRPFIAGQQANAYF